MKAGRQIPGFEGQLIAPDDPDYESARLTDNAAVDARPALIARAAGATDVAAVVRWLPASGLQLAIRSGGA